MTGLTLAVVLAACDQSSTDETYEPKPPYVFSPNTQPGAWPFSVVECELPLFRPDGTWVIFMVSSVASHKWGPGAAPNANIKYPEFIVRSNSNLGNMPVIFLDSGERVSPLSTGDWTYSLADTEKVAGSRSATWRWGVYEYEFNVASMAQLNLFLDAVNELKAE